MNRLFVAIDLPESAKEAVVDMGCKLPGARWVPKEQLHLTLRFIGDTDDLTQPVIRAALRQVVSPRFSLALSGIGHFPPGKHPRVLWVGMTASLQLSALQHQVELALMEAGIPPDERSFSPHITIARLRETPAPMVLSLEEREKAFATEPFRVPEFHLYASKLTSAGAIHTIVESYPLAG